MHDHANKRNPTNAVNISLLSEEFDLYKNKEAIHDILTNRIASYTYISL